MPTQDEQPTHIRNARQLNSLACKLTNSQTHELINSQTCKLTNSRTHKLIASLIQRVKLLSFTLQYYSNFHSILARKQVKKLLKSHYYPSFMLFELCVFKNKTHILHYFAFLFSLPTHYFLHSITHFLPLKNHFLWLFCPFQPCFSWF